MKAERGKAFADAVLGKNRKTILYAREFLVTQINHWTLFPILMLFFCMAKSIYAEFDDPSPLLWLEAGILPVLFWIFRVKNRHFLALIVCHGAAAVLFGALLFLESPSSGWVYGIGAGCYAVYSIIHRLSGEELEDGRVNMPVAVGISAVSLFLQHHQGYTEWDFWYVASLIAVFALYFLSFYLERYLNFMEVNAGSAGHLPEREIFSSGSQMTVLFVLFAVLVLFLTSDIGWLRSILGIVRKVIYAILRVLLSGSKGGEQELMEEEPAKGADSGVMELPPAGEPFFLWEVLERAAEAALLCAAVYAAVRLLLRLYAFIRERMGRGRSHRTGGTDQAVVDVRERCGVERMKRVGARRSPLSFLSTEERIRRLYKKQILSAADTDSAKHESADLSLLTAREWGARLQKKELAAPYEKARYSGESCTAEDLRRMKDACRQSTK